MSVHSSPKLTGCLGAGSAAFLLGLVTVLPAPSARAAPPPDSYELTAVVRDFIGGDEPGGHEDFERNSAMNADGVMIEVVSPVLGPDGKPVWQGFGRTIKQASKKSKGCKDSSGRPICYTLFDSSLGDTPLELDSKKPGGFTGKANFDMWYRDVPGVNLSLPITLTVTRQADGTYQYSDTHDLPDGYFPIDNRLFGNSKANNKHNFHFTSEIQGTFIYDAAGGQMFRFLGDDDVWVFIDNKLVIDLSNTHRAYEQYVDMNRLGLTHGQQYSLHLFQAERQTDGSHFTFTTNLLLSDAMIPNMTASFD